jgi:mRNA-degrading endonuclease RelE of RelBE toxin-antitoxin system
MPQFTSEFTEEALESLTFLRKHEQVVVLDAIGLQLASEPVAETRNRKPLRPNELSQWELRVGHLRVFYNVDLQSAIVTVVAVGWKENNNYYICGKEFQL